MILFKIAAKLDPEALGLFGCDEDVVMSRKEEHKTKESIEDPSLPRDLPLSDRGSERRRFYARSQWQDIEVPRECPSCSCSIGAKYPRDFTTAALESTSSILQVMTSRYYDSVGDDYMQMSDIILGKGLLSYGSWWPCSVRSAP